MSMKFKVVLEKCEEGGYFIECPALPGCMTQGETKQEALHNIKEAIEGWIETYYQRKTPSLEKKHGQILEVAI